RRIRPDTDPADSRSCPRPAGPRPRNGYPTRRSAPRTIGRRRRTPPGQRCGRQGTGSWLLQPSKDLGPDLFPGDDVIRRGVVFGDAPRELLALRLAEEGWLWLC